MRATRTVMTETRDVSMVVQLWPSPGVLTGICRQQTPRSGTLRPAQQQSFKWLRGLQHRVLAIHRSVSEYR